jgi:hypothetical protein
VYANNYAGGKIGVLDCRGEGAFTQAHFLARYDAPAVPFNRGYFAQQILIRDWRIGLRHRVALGRNSVSVPCHDAMHHEPVLASAQDDVTFGYHSGIGALDDECIAGADRRQHAPSRNSQAQTAR